MEKRFSWRSLFFWLTLILVLLVAGMIFFFSSQPADQSTQTSGSVMAFLLGLFGLDADTMAADQLGLVHTVVRKLAHFTEFGMLGFSLLLHLRVGRRKRGMAAAWVLGTLYAVSDELHQMFEAGRGPQLRDVAIDSAGVLAGVLVCAGLWALFRLFRQKKCRKGLQK